MKNYFQILFTLSCILLVHTTLSAQIQVLRTLPNFDKISASGSVDVYLSQGNGNSYMVEASDDQMEDVSVQVVNGNLEIKNKTKIKWGWGGNDETIKVYVTFDDINSLRSSGSTDMYSEMPLDFDNLDIDVSGASDIKLSLNANRVYINTSGASDIVLMGNANMIEIEASGSSDVKAKNLQTKIANISSSGACDIHISVSEELSASASGASDIYYYGNPIVQEISTSGASDVIKKPL